MKYIKFLEARFCYFGDLPAIWGVEEDFVRVVWVVCDFVFSCGFCVYVRVDRFCGECGVSWVPPLRLFRGRGWCCANLFACRCFRDVVVINCCFPAGGCEYRCFWNP